LYEFVRVKVWGTPSQGDVPKTVEIKWFSKFISSGF
jgi:hypothetical protein